MQFLLLRPKINDKQTNITHQNNCFDTIRLFSALLVLYSHHFFLNGKSEPTTLHHFQTVGGVAVMIFFAVSGYLVTKSGLNSPNFLSFIKKRIGRIFPALIVCSLLIYGVLYPIIGSGKAYSKDTLLAILRLISLQNGGVDPLNMTKGFIWSNAIDGSLWTLPLEFSCYLILGIAFCFAKNIKSILTVLLIFTILTIIVLATPTSAFSNFNFYSIPVKHFFPRVINFFIGSLMALSEELWDKKQTKLFIAIIGSIWLYSMTRTPEMNLFGYLIIPAIVIIIGVSFKDKLIKGRFDYSYGIYIYAFPTQQIIINYTTLTFWPNMLVSLVITLALASLSWHLLVEKPVLNKIRKQNSIV